MNEHDEVTRKLLIICFVVVAKTWETPPFLIDTVMLR